jgi:hypothetical protein
VHETGVRGNTENKRERCAGSQVAEGYAVAHRARDRIRNAQRLEHFGFGLAGAPEICGRAVTRITRAAIG